MPILLFPFQSYHLGQTFFYNKLYGWVTRSMPITQCLWNADFILPLYFIDCMRITFFVLHVVLSLSIRVNNNGTLKGIRALLQYEIVKTILGKEKRSHAFPSVIPVFDFSLLSFSTSIIILILLGGEHCHTTGSKFMTIFIMFDMLKIRCCPLLSLSK